MKSAGGGKISPRGWLLLLSHQYHHHHPRRYPHHHSSSSYAQTRKALSYLDRAKALDPTCSDVWLTRAQCLQGDSTKKAEALESYTRGVALAVAAVGCGVWTNLGCLQHEHGKLAAARRSYMNALEADYMQHEAGLDPEVQIRNIHV